MNKADKHIMFDKYVSFRTKEIRPKRIVELIRLSTSPIENIDKFITGNLDNDERDIGIALIKEYQWESIATDLNSTIKKEDLSELWRSLLSHLSPLWEEPELLLPLFFSYDLKTERSDYLKDQSVRDSIYKIYIENLMRSSTSYSDENVLIEKLKKDYLRESFKPHCYSSLTNEFENVCMTMKKEYGQYQERSGYWVGLFTAAFIGPLAYLTGYLAAKENSDSWYPIRTKKRI